MNFSGAVPGYVQTNQRAELLAVVLACLRDPRPLDIRSDSEYVCRGFDNRGLWAKAGWSGEHSDLWNQLSCELSARASHVSIAWVKGHAKRIDIERGRTTAVDKWGNDGADALAVQGAEMHRVPAHVVQSARARKTSAKIVQGMMVAVLKARFCAEAAHAPAVRDRGSDPGNFDDMDCLDLSQHDADGGVHVSSLVGSSGTCLATSVLSSLCCTDCIDCIETPQEHVTVACDEVGTSPDSIILSSLYSSDCADCIGPLDDAIVTGMCIVTDTEHQHSCVGAASDTEHSFASFACTNTLHDGLTSL